MKCRFCTKQIEEIDDGIYLHVDEFGGYGSDEDQDHTATPERDDDDDDDDEDDEDDEDDD